MSQPPSGAWPEPRPADPTVPFPPAQPAVPQTAPPAQAEQTAPVDPAARTAVMPQEPPPEWAGPQVEPPVGAPSDWTVPQVEAGSPPEWQVPSADPQNGAPPAPSAEEPSPYLSPYPEPPARRPITGWIVAIIGAVVVIALGIGVYFVLKDDDKSNGVVALPEPEPGAVGADPGTEPQGVIGDTDSACETYLSLGDLNYAGNPDDPEELAKVILVFTRLEEQIEPDMKDEVADVRSLFQATQDLADGGGAARNGSGLSSTYMDSYKALMNWAQETCQ